MRLAEFILVHMDQILSDWDAFARTLEPATSDMSALALRDHAKAILQAIAKDMGTQETAREQREKSEGLAPVHPDSAAGTHGTLRHISGFSLLQLTAEYRALRATVLRLWLPQIRQFDEAISIDMVRFNETIDQALAESVLTYSEQGLRTRDTFLAILGHDLRSPLATMTLAGQLLLRSNVDAGDQKLIGHRIKRSAATMTTMVNDLLEYARTQLGGAMQIVAELQDLSPICQAALEDAQAAHPECVFHYDASGDLSGNFDANRMQQVLSNLLNNAGQYSRPGQPVNLTARGEPDAIVLQVTNFGPPIPSESIQAIFNPLVQLSADDTANGRPATSIGLGLFIAQEITTAHGGTIGVVSSAASGTIFTVRIAKSLAGQELGRMQNSRAA